MATKTTKRTTAKSSAKQAKSDKVDFEPNKMALAIATLSVVILLLLAIIATQG